MKLKFFRPPGMPERSLVKLPYLGTFSTYGKFLFMFPLFLFFIPSSCHISTKYGHPVILPSCLSVEIAWITQSDRHSHPQARICPATGSELEVVVLSSSFSWKTVAEQNRQETELMMRDTRRFYQNQG